ncbi:MAG TPA: Maf family protein [Steroidobacteraceae bacterium]|nr:Maf family protein [Steroidobacteraceae bacterium]
MSPPIPVLCLASGSPRRRELLTQIGVVHTVRGADIDETVLPAESPRDYVVRLARRKAVAVREQGERLPVLAADTTVVLDGVVLGKPRDREDALAMLARLGGRAHEVLTAVALVDRRGTRERLSASVVRMRSLTETEREWYWDSGEPRDKAGSYAIQGLGAMFIESLTGSYSAVMGLPLFETAQLLQEAGIAWCSPTAGRGARP